MSENEKTKKEMTLLERLLDAGYPEGDIDHHESDLYVYVTPLSTSVIDAWCKENNYSKDWHCPTFKDQITGRMMYDCAFQYYNYKEATQRPSDLCTERPLGLSTDEEMDRS